MPWKVRCYAYYGSLNQDIVITSSFVLSKFGDAKEIRLSDNKKISPGQMRFPDFGDVNNDSQVRKVVEKFVLVNCYNLQVAMLLFEDYKVEETNNIAQQWLLSTEWSGARYRKLRSSNTL
ncbi:MAG: hypothetical protein QNJ72_35375 [Pleurocapsa sp. MO_226.B13]|nr:hypothetical protein [Pleurocapsa sp. MO_226.B13]